MLHSSSSSRLSRCCFSFPQRPIPSHCGLILLRSFHPTLSHSYRSIRERFVRRSKPNVSGDLLTQNLYTPSPFKLLRSSPLLSEPSLQQYPDLPSLGFLPEITQAIQAVIQPSNHPQKQTSNLRPTEIQVLAARHFFSKKSSPSTPILFAAETGSGKTLAYLSCLFQQLKQDEQQVLEDPGPLVLPSGSKKPMRLRRLHRPRALVLVPTLDLLQQVGNVAKLMSHHAKLRVVTMSTSTSSTHLKRIWKQPVDVLITTPGTLDRWKERVGLAETRWVVLDEADFLLDQGFERETKQTFALISKIAQTRQRSITLCFASATVPWTLLQTLQQENIRPTLLSTHGLHRSPTTCRHTFLQTSERFGELQRTLQTHHQNQTLVFCNTKDEVERVYVYLTRMFPNSIYKCLGNQTLDERRAVWLQFQDAGILVCTDLVSRGLDTNCSLVINFDFPRSALEYLHRSGRTARAGKKGQVISFVTKKNQTLVKALQQRLSRKQDFAVTKWPQDFQGKRLEINEKEVSEEEDEEDEEENEEDEEENEEEEEEEEEEKMRKEVC